MNFEVEIKYAVQNLPSFIERVSQLDGSFEEPIIQEDSYFQHPNRDFSQTDEALRIRQVGDQHFITYKGPKFDSTTKTRQEIELPIGTGNLTGCHFSELLTALGFTLVAKVKKKRRNAKVDWQDRLVTISIDDLDEMGTFVEIELISTKDSLSQDQESLLQLANHFGLTNSLQTSYLEMLLASRQC